MDNREFYKNYHDQIFAKRYNSNNQLRSYVHKRQYDSILFFVKKGMKILDAGCGEGVLSFLMARKGAIVTGCDISKPNINSCKKRAIKEGLNNVTFIEADLGNMPFDDEEFDLVVSSHVLEHLPDFDEGFREIMRVTKNYAIIAIPTVLNFCSIVQIGGGMFWLKGKKILLSLPFGIFRLIFSLILRREGVNENYLGNKELVHIFRFPWIMLNKVKKEGYRLESYEASSVCFPYFNFLLLLTKILDKHTKKKFFRNFGYGTTYVVKKN